MPVIPANAGILCLCSFAQGGMAVKQPVGYVLASERNGTLYVGVTSDLVQRTWQHRNDLAEGFSNTYRTHKLVYFELHQSMDDAILREKQIKKWRRDWKIELIEQNNPYWRDLYPEILDGAKCEGAGFPLSRE